MPYIRFVAAFVVYAVVDIVWNISPIATGMYANLHEESGSKAILDTFGKQMDTWGGTELLSLLAFFLLIALANSYLAIEPALREGSLRRAALSSFVLGCAAYATYIAPLYVTFATWPTALVPIDILIGGLLSLITSTAVTFVALRRRSA